MGIEYPRADIPDLNGERYKYEDIGQVQQQQQKKKNKRKNMKKKKVEWFAL